MVEFKTGSSFSDKLNQINQKINDFFSFVVDKLKNFKDLTLGEQISYCCVGIGLVLVLVSIVLFVW